MSLTELQQVVLEIQERHNLTPRQVFSAEAEIFMPITLFANRSMGVLEILVKYLHENHAMRFADIARLLNRDPRTIWCTYAKAKRKAPYRLIDMPSKQIPISAFQDRNLAALESLVKYCKQTLLMSNPEISKIINRDTRTIWAVVNK